MNLNSKIKDLFPDRDIGLNKRYIEYINSLDNEELKKEYYDKISKLDSFVTIIKIIMLSLCVGIVIKLSLLFINFINLLNDSTLLPSSFNITEAGSLNLIINIGFFILILIIIAMTMVYIVLMCHCLNIKKALYLSDVLKSRGIWNEVGEIK